MEFDTAHRVIIDAIAGRMFPAAVIEVGTSDRVLDSHAFGTLTFEESALPAEIHTPFDLASLTKVVATTTAVMQLVARGLLQLDDPVASYFEEWRGEDRQDVRIVDLLEHASGLAARLVDLPGSGRREFEHDIATMRLEYPPRTRSIYSDLGFILLGFLVADRGASAEPAASLESVVSDFALPFRDPLTFTLTVEDAQRTAPTVPLDNDSRRGRLLAGEVHDDYAAALGGTAGHAGLFGTAPAVGRFARMILRGARGDIGVPRTFDPAIISRFVTRSAVPGSSRALGWDTMLPTSSCGTHMSASAFGHVGYTGTSLWIDPVRDRYFVLLTNRACGGGAVDQMRDVRRAFHDALRDV
jgi:CubicO group peptidase (beta-lactamase class C family)